MKEQKNEAEISEPTPQQGHPIATGREISG